jgi:1,4-alpha-glucan branching enzyme
VADLNYDNTAMHAAMQEAMLYWLTEADIDGFRCDHAEGVPNDFWKDTITKLRAAKSTLLMLAEGSQTALYDAGFDMLYAWNFAYKLQDVYAGSASVANLYDTHRSELASVTDKRLLMRYSTNHDMASEKSPVQAYQTKEGAFSAFVASISMGGCPMIYSSQELAYDKALSFFGYQAMDWNSNADYQADYTKLMQLIATLPLYRMERSNFIRRVKRYALSYFQYGKDTGTDKYHGNQERLNLPMERVGIVQRISGPEAHRVAKDDYVGALSILHLENRRII